MNRRHPIALTVAALALAACTKEAAPPVASGSPSPTASETPSAPVPSSPPATPSTKPSEAPAGEGRVAVYYLHDAATAKLYREFRLVRRGTAVVRAAVDAMLHIAPLDPDYRSAWPAATTVNGISVHGAVATVDLSSAARGRTASATVERQSLQQLVHTVTAAASSITGVRLRFDGATKATLWGHVSTSGTLTRAPAVDTLGAVWVVAPAQRSTIGRSLTASGVASVFEATVSWSLTRLDGSPIASGHVNAAEAGPARAPWTVTVAIPASVTGDIVFKAYESSAEDGSEQSPDDKRFTVS